MNPTETAEVKKSTAVPPKIARMREIHQGAIQAADPKRVEAQHKKGKLTARERLAYLLDENSFREVDLLMETRATDFGLQDKSVPGDGVVAGFGKIHGRPVAIYAQDFTLLGGSLGQAHAYKICKVMDFAIENKMPIIALNDSGGARIQEGVDSLDGYARIFYRNVRASGVVPQISAILGPCAGGAVYSPALTDFVFMVEGVSHMFITGPEVVQAATGEETDFESLGGAVSHASKSGVCHFMAGSEPDCFRQIRELVQFLPQSSWEKPAVMQAADPATRPTPLLEMLCTLDPKKPYWVQHVIRQLADEHRFLEVHKEFAKNIVVGFMRLAGNVVGVVANNPAHMAGALDINASEKASRFVRFCNAFQIPILTLVDVPGYWPGVEQEHGGIIRKGAKLLYAYCEATVPKVTLVLRKAYGGAYIAMSSKFLRGDFNFALPSAEVAVMGPQGAVNILFSKELAEAENKDAKRAELIQEYQDKFASPYQAAKTGSIDSVIEPSRSREMMIWAFEMLNKKRLPGQSAPKGNIPL